MKESMPTKILLTILPYWDPMIPPMGITSLKSFLEKYGYIVKTVDFIVKDENLFFYANYFEVLEKIVPQEKRGNFYNIGHDVLQQHMMAIQNYNNYDEYIELLKLVIYHHFYTDAKKEFVIELDELVSRFYIQLESDFTKLLDDFRPDVVGVTAYKCTLPASLFVLRLTKTRYPNVKTLMGGGTFNESNAEGSPNFEALLTYSSKFLDKIIIGQGELLFLKYLQGQLPEDQRVYTKSDIDDRILQFDEQDIPDFSDLNIQKYPFLANTASVSCLYECSFCVAKKVSGAYRKKNTELLANEMVEMGKLYNRQLFFMTDSLINPVLTDMANEFIKQNLSFYYDAYFKVDTKSSDIRNTLLWRKGGLYRVRLGTESGSQKILDAMDKKITVEQIKACISSLAFAGIKTTTYWVIGHPGETEEDFQMTLDLISQLKDDIFQAECNYFLYHYSQQAKGDLWAPHRMYLYPEHLRKPLLFDYYTLDMYPLRELTFERVHRFEEHCRALGIPNPYSYEEHIEADKRWKRLHKNAVPPIVDFLKNDKYINENLNIEVQSFCASKISEMNELSF